MSRKPHADHLLEALRRVPPELSRKQVVEIIKILPTLPPLPEASAWSQLINHFTFKNILMMSLSITLLTTVVLLTSTPQEAPIGAAEPLSVSPPIGATADQEEPSAVPSIPLEAVPPKQLAAENIQEEKIPLTRSLDPEKAVPEEETAAASPVPELPTLPAQKPGSLTSTETAPPVLPDAYPACNEPLKFAGEIRGFRGRLLRMLVQDDLIAAGQDVRLWFNRGILMANQTAVPADRQDDYQRFLDGYGVRACPVRIVQIRSAYIAVGDITAEGFRGQTRGSLDLRELNEIKLPISGNW